MNKILILVFLLFTQILVSAQSSKVVGYLPYYRFDLNNSIDYCKVTHLNLSFANPDSDGNLKIKSFTNIVNTARQQNPNVVICISLGGGALSAEVMQNWKNLIDIPANSPAFISKIINFVESKNLDGVDFDLEWNAVTSGYSNFVIALNDSLKAHNKLFTAALPATYRYSQITNAALQVFDFINIMAYDATGPWSPNKPGQHSSYNFAKKGIQFWKNQNVNSDKLVIGVPFYGYNFVSSSNVYSFTYAEMVNKNVAYADVDNVENAYYNGRPTIENKVELASNEVSGIMIWELGQDRFDEYSLLTTIHNKFTALGFTTTGLCGNIVSIDEISEVIFKVYPNPATNIITVKNKGINGFKVSLLNIYGQKLPVYLQDRFNSLTINVEGLPRGIYLIQIENDGFLKPIK